MIVLDVDRWIEIVSQPSCAKNVDVSVKSFKKEPSITEKCRWRVKNYAENLIVGILGFQMNFEHDTHRCDACTLNEEQQSIRQ